MKRAIRRQQQQRAKIRKLKILYHEAHGHSWRAFVDDGWLHYSRLSIEPHYAKPWRAYHHLRMSEPGWHIHEFMTVPARIRANQILRLIEMGRDPDEFQWPDGKKPYIYYW